MAVTHISRTSASTWERAILDRDFVILDTETTGLWPEDEIVEIAVINGQGEVLLDQRIEPVNPSRLLKRDQKGTCAADIHGIYPSMLKGMPAFPEVFRQLLPHISLRPVVIYNADYDLKMLGQDCARHGLQLPLLQSDCAMKQFAAWNGQPGRMPGEYRWVRLEQAVTLVGTPSASFELHAHSALGDCLRTLAVLRGMAALD